MGKRTVRIFAVLVLCLLWAGAYGQSDKPSEYQVKAAFLYNFANFVEWPATAFSDSTAPFVIAILGEDPFGDILVQIVKGESAGKHKIEIRHWKSVDEIGVCHILFTMFDGRQQIETMLRKLKSPSVLTVGEMKGFAIIGGIIEFVNDNNRVRFEVNVDAANRAHLTISSKLQKVAKRIVED